MSIDVFKRLNKILIMAVLFTIGLWSVGAQTTVINPASGVWANYQSLVLDVSEDSEAYYSLSGEDPLVFGFAYDEPVLLNVDGDVQLKIVIVTANASTETYTINYTVNVQSPPSYIPVVDSEALIKLSGSQLINIPKTALYSLGDQKVFSSGHRLEISENMLFERNIVITLQDGDIPFRYVLQIGDSSASIPENPILATTNFLPDGETLPLVQNTIEFTDWNYLSFVGGGPIIYSIDDEPLEQTKSGKIFLDRKKNHTIKWKKNDDSENTEFSTLFIPSRPDILGLPKIPSVNSSVNLSLSDERYVFAWESDSGEMIFTPIFTVDTLLGDAFGFSENIYIYYEGMKQGSISPVFIIDKILPATPIITASDTSGYARDEVTLTLQVEDKVHYYIPSPITSIDGFTADQYERDIPPPPVSKEEFILLEGNTLLLDAAGNTAYLYTVYVYTSDFAGNTSDIVSYQTVVDPYNYYLVQNPLKPSSSQNGTKEYPFTNFLQLHAMLNKIDGQRIYMDGVFTDIPSFTINSSTSFLGTSTTRLLMGENASIQVTNAVFTIMECTVEQNYSNTDILFQSSLIKATNSALVFLDCEFLFYGGNSGACFDLDVCSLEIVDSGITVQTSVYGVGIAADRSVVLLINLRSVIIAETAVGMSFNETSSVITDSSVAILGKLGRGIEFTSSHFSLRNNSFTFETLLNDGQSKNEIGNTAVWLDVHSQMNINSDNSYIGFSSLFAGL